MNNQSNTVVELISDLLKDIKHYRMMTREATLDSPTHAEKRAKQFIEDHCNEIQDSQNSI